MAWNMSSRIYVDHILSTCRLHNDKKRQRPLLQFQTMVGSDNSQRDGHTRIRHQSTERPNNGNGRMALAAARVRLQNTTAAHQNGNGHGASQRQRTLQVNGQFPRARGIRHV